MFDAQTDFWGLLQHERSLGCVLIDESQFLTPDQVRQLHRIAHTIGTPTICFGLRSDFQGNAFPGAAQLLTLADAIEEIQTICSCGHKATMNIRLVRLGQRVREGQQVEIGGNERYQQVCARCFYQEA